MYNPLEMSKEEAKAIISEVYGHRGQTRAAADIRRGVVTVNRWINGETPVGAMETLLLRLILILHRKGMSWPKWIGDYERETVAKVEMDDII